VESAYERNGELWKTIAGRHRSIEALGRTGRVLEAAIRFNRGGILNLCGGDAR
jgi:hypothetical protein